MNNFSNPAYTSDLLPGAMLVVVVVVELVVGVVT